MTRLTEADFENKDLEILMGEDFFWALQFSIVKFKCSF